MWRWLKKSSGKADAAEEFEMTIPEGKKLVIFVCTANLSRSPMAEAMFRYEIQEWADEIVVGSCGTKSVPGFSPTPEALTVLQAHGYPTDGLVTHRISEGIVRRSDFIFAMGDVHLKAIRAKYPYASDKTYLITDFCEDEHDRGLDVLDPHERPLDAFLEVYDLLGHLVPRVADFVIDGPDESWKRWYDFYRGSKSALGR